MATILFFAVTIALVFAWNALFRPVPWRIAIGIWLAIALYQGETLFTRKVDVPGGLAYAAYPWKALNREAARANTGIAFQQMIPWTETAREILKSGEAPLWNRYIGSGTPLLSDQQNAIAHPFTLLGLFLPIGKAWTLSVALRLFFALFFLFVFLRNQQFHDAASFFGAITYGFCTFHIITLVMPLGLTMMMLPMALAATDELLRRPRIRSFVFLVLALAFTVLAGHPEAELWVGLTAGAYALYVTVAERTSWRPLAAAGAAALSAVLLTAFFWYPTVAVLKNSNRYNHMTTLLEQRIKHHIGAEWFMVLVSPNILGTSQGDTYRPPEPRSGDLLDDYGETACGYAGLATMALAFAALPLAWRRRPGRFALGATVIALLTIAEAPGWQQLLRQIPIINVAMLQRFRLILILGVVILAVIALDAWIRGEMRWRNIAIGALVAGVLLAAVLAGGLPSLLPRISQFELLQILAPVVVLAWLLIASRFIRPTPFVLSLAALTFVELVLITWRYNPPAAPDDLFPTTGAIRAMQSESEPYRMLARGWSFLPDTPGYYGLEDVKTTSPFSTPAYLFLFRGYHGTAGFDQIVANTHYAFTDYLNVRHLYVPPGETPGRDDVVEIYRGADGAVYRIDKALPRYFMPRRFDVELGLGETIAKMRDITDYRQRAFVDHIPDKVKRLAPQLPNDTEGGEVRLLHYGPNTTDLVVDSRGWNLLVSSDTYWPGWRAYWNGRRMPPVIVNGAFVGLFVPPGRAIVRFQYRPREFDRGVQVAVATLIILVAALLIHARLRKRRNTSPAESASAA